MFSMEDTLREYHDRVTKAKRMDWHLSELLYGEQWTQDKHRDAVATKSECSLPAMRYLERLASLAPEGPCCELGVWRGMSALTLRKARKGALYLVDSFEGLRGPSLDDAWVSDAAGVRGLKNVGGFATEEKRVRELLPDAVVIRGWVPEILDELPETKWAFVHVDLDLAEPTAAAIAYFQDRMLPGSFIVEDQYASLRFPGAGRVWDKSAFSERLDVLPTGQGVVRC